MQQKLKDRVTSLKRFVYVAQACVKYNNYNTLFEIVAGLNLGPVTRLKKTWKSLPKKYWDVWNDLNRIVSSESSYRVYRQSLRTQREKSGSGAILPYLGVNLSDLTFAEDGNPTYVGAGESKATPEPANQRTINFSKFRLVSSIMQNVLQLQQGEFDFKVDERVQHFLRVQWTSLDDAELYEHSRNVEARVTSTVG
ncbi:ras guanine nucleotide exchange factor domain-containing protein [Blyttiomyces helicus]|uniref:Ras guanine nucleotide exchange factor domain-containing protein n=1 Tax=Blyttiomyces helicus TaxID=388810 RepID=A0A4P9WJ61_9FUNG|nr:ras guanine nucleotide exchange factor domain-containing protein [Blyttiomyces helicus]|eukprot:RKO92949.1 ras guanine nucleotide exchange factor domain-containing protein [Blyttiomyces helicus]